MKERRFGALSSSVDPSQLSKTVEAVMKVVAGIAVYFGAGAVLPDIHTIQDQVTALIQLGVQAAPMVYAIYNAAEAIFGALRKILAYFFGTTSD